MEHEHEAGGEATERGAPGPHTDDEHRARLRREWTIRAVKLVVLAVIVGIFVAFIVRNSGPTRIDFLFFERSPRLIWIMLACALLGGIVGFVLGRPGRGFRFHSTEEPTAPDEG